MAKPSNVLRWSAALGALPRILGYRNTLAETALYFDRLRIVNEALGAHWVFRLADVVGIDVIKKNRFSWYSFYIEDVDRLHCPLDPGAPETEIYLGREYSDMDMAFYAGMGFDGYRLALQTQRVVDFENKSVYFDNQYRFLPSNELKASLDVYDVHRSIPKEDYYAMYSDALISLYNALDKVMACGDHSESLIERAAAGCLMLLCGGHRGCSKHINQEERFQAQMESMIIFGHVRSILIGQGLFANDDLVQPNIRAVA